MSRKALQEAHMAYDLEGAQVKKRLEADPTYTELIERLADLETRLGRKVDPELAAGLASARELVLEMTREAAFKMGFLTAHRQPLDQIVSYKKTDEE